jgi:predicted RNase H-like nuclease (RuvC/YqgF family)
LHEALSLDGDDIACGPDVQRGKQLMAKVSRVETENKTLEWQLQEHDAALTQLSMTRKQLAEATTAYNQIFAECQSLKRHAEDMVTRIASLKKARPQSFLNALRYFVSVLPRRSCNLHVPFY